jgi:hypothetical protein
MVNICIQIQTHTPHFHYTHVLIRSLLDKTDIVTKNIPIYIAFDNKESSDVYHSKYHYEYSEVYNLLIDEIISSMELPYTETKNTLFKEVIPIQWGAGGHRNYVSVKRVYSLLELHNLKYTHVWCMDCESLVLKSFSLDHIIESNVEKPLLVIGKNNNGVKYPNVVKTILNMDYDDNYKNISVRMNDFWFIHTSYFHKMICEIMEKHQKPVSYFMNGSEQSVYEYYLYSLYRENPDCVKLIEIQGDLHGNNLFRQILHSVNYTENDRNKIACEINEKYFQYVQSFRGDYYRMTSESEKGKQWLALLDINMAVSNYQGI